MRIFGSLLGFIIAVIIGAAGLWIAARFVHIPGIKATNNTGTNISPKTNTGTNNQNSQNNQAKQNNVTSTNTKALVSGFPTNTPVYQPSTLALSTKTSRGNNAVVYTATYTSTDQTTAVVQYYKNQLNSGGWSIDSQEQSGSITTIRATGNNEQLNVIVSPMTSGQTTGSETINSGFVLSVTPNS